MRPHERPKIRWEVNIKMNLKEVDCEGVDWIRLVQIGACSELMNMVIKVQIP
jgi:hypothetical protein